MTSSLAVPTWLAVAVLAGAVVLVLVTLLLLRAVAREHLYQAYTFEVFLSDISLLWA